jgi:hypothetical protein
MIPRRDPLRPPRELGVGNRQLTRQKLVEGQTDADLFKTVPLSSNPPTNGDVYTYDSAAVQFVPRPPPASSGVGGPTHPRDFAAIVDLLGTGDYTTIAAAITAQAPTIFVRNGSHAGFTIASTDATVMVQGESENAIITETFTCKKACIFQNFKVQPTSATVDVQNNATGIEYRNIRFQAAGGFGVRCKPFNLASPTATAPKWFDCIWDGNPSGISAITDIRTGTTRLNLGKLVISRCRFENMATGTIPVIDIGGLSTGTDEPTLENLRFVNCQTNSAIPLVQLRAGNKAVFNACTTDRAEGGFLSAYGSGQLVCNSPVLRIPSIPAGNVASGIMLACADAIISNPLCMVSGVGAGATFYDIEINVSGSDTAIVNPLFFSTSAQAGRTGLMFSQSSTVMLTGGTIGGCQSGVDMTNAAYLGMTGVDLQTIPNTTNVVGRDPTRASFINCRGTDVGLAGSTVLLPEVDNEVQAASSGKRFAAVYAYLVDVASQALPYADLGADLGSASKRWTNLYAQTANTTYLFAKGLRLNSVLKSGTYTLADNDFLVRADASGGAFTLNLPSAGTFSGQVYVIKKVDSSANAVTIDASTTQTIDGELTQMLETQYASLTLVCDGSNWHIA